MADTDQGTDEGILRTLPDGKTTLVFPKDWTKEQQDKYIAHQDFQRNLDALTPPAQDQQAGKIIPPVEGSPSPAIQYRGPMREPLIAGGQLLRGAASPFALPGDVLTAANTLSAGTLENTFPGLRSFPTTQSLDRFFTDIGVTPTNLTPEGFWENELAGGMRGVGQAGSTLLGARSPVLGYSQYPWARVGSFGQNALTGAASGLASTGTEQLLSSVSNPDQNFSYGPLAPPVMGAAAGFLTGGGIGRFMATPYERAVRNIGGNIKGGRPLQEDAGNMLRNDLNSTFTTNFAAGPTVGAGGWFGTDLTQKDYEALTNPKASGTDIKNLALQEHVAPILRDEQPTAMDTIAASHLANARKAEDWMDLHKDTKNALIQDPIDRAAIENAFRGGVLPGQQGFLARLGAAAAREGRHILGGVMTGTGVEAAHLFMDMAHNDPTLTGSLKLIGAVALPTYLTTRYLLGTRVGRQTLLGGAVGMGPGSYLAPSVLRSQGLLPGETLRPQPQQ